MDAVYSEIQVSTLDKTGCLRRGSSVRKLG